MRAIATCFRARTSVYSQGRDSSSNVSALVIILARNFYVNRGTSIWVVRSTIGVGDRFHRTCEHWIITFPEQRNSARASDIRCFVSVGCSPLGVAKINDVVQAYIAYCPRRKRRLNIGVLNCSPITTGYVIDYIPSAHRRMVKLQISPGRLGDLL